MLNISVRFLSEIVTRVGGLILFPLLANYLGPEGYGVYAQAGAINGVLIPIATIGLGLSVVRLVSGTSDPIAVSSRLLSSLALVGCISLALSLATFASAPVLSGLFIKVGTSVPVIRWSAFMIMSTALTLTVSEYYRARLRVIAFSALQILGTVATVGSVAVVLSHGGDLLAVVKALLAVQTGQFVFMIAYLVFAGDLTVGAPSLPWAESAAMVRFGIPIVITGISTWVFASSDRLLIGYFLNAQEAGIYNAAYSLAVVPTAFAAPFWYSMFPLMAIHQKRHETQLVAAICRRYSSAFFLIGVPALVGLTVLSSETLRVMGSDGFSIRPLMFAMIGIGLFADQFSGTSQYLIYLHNEPHFLRNATVLAGATNLGLNILLIPVTGIMGAAAATLASYVLLDTLIVRRALSYGYTLSGLYNFSALRRIVGSATAMMLVLVAAKQTFAAVDLRSLILLVLTGGLAYAASLWATNGCSIRRLIAFARFGSA